MSATIQHRAVPENEKIEAAGEMPTAWTDAEKEDLLDHLRAERRRNTMMTIPKIRLEEAVVFPPAQPGLAGQKKSATIPSVQRVRPGKSKTGEPQTKEYFFRVRTSDAKWLKSLQSQWQISLSKLVLGVGMGWWSLPLVRLAPAQPASRSGKSTLSLSIRDDQLRKLCANAKTVSPQNPDPVRYCVMATLGRVQVAEPGPILLTTAEQLVVRTMQRAVQLRHRSNLMARHFPDVDNVERLRRQVYRRIVTNGLTPGDTVRAEKLKSVGEQLAVLTELCGDTYSAWAEFELIAEKIALPQKRTEGQI